MYKLSILLPGIRPGNWKRLYDSICESYSGSWELIIISPYELPHNVRFHNVKWIKSWRSPTASQQIGLLEATGEYITYAADDGVFLPGAIDIAMKSLEGTTETVVCGKYNEGAPNSKMLEIEYYHVWNHEGTRCKYMPKDCLMLMVAIIPRSILMEVGGFDCKFEALPMSFVDLSIRLYNRKCKFIFQAEQMFSCGHMPGVSGDHKPINDAQIFKDEPMLKIIYSREESQKRINIDINNWKNTQERWLRRFGNEGISSTP